MSFGKQRKDVIGVCWTFRLEPTSDLQCGIWHGHRDDDGDGDNGDYDNCDDDDDDDDGDDDNDDDDDDDDDNDDDEMYGLIQQ